MHPTIATVNLQAIRDNVAAFKRYLAPATKFCAVLKADGYGHGAVEVARAALDAGADWLAVAYISEARELRQHGITAPVLLLSYIAPCDYAHAVINDITLTVMTYDCAEELSQTACVLGRTARVQIKINTGMNRLGVHYTRAIEFVQSISQLPNLVIEGVFSHFATADERDLTFARLQLQRFHTALDQLRSAGIDCGIRHICNSAGTLSLPEAHLDMVRVGIAMYGLYPSACTPRSVPLLPAMRLTSLVSQVIDCAANEPVSYGGHFVTRRASKLAVIPIGYADGYARALSNTASALIGGRRVPQVGRICMDQCLFDVTGQDIAIGDEVILFDECGLTIDEVAGWLNTINYEICCGISKRIPREYSR